MATILPDYLTCSSLHFLKFEIYPSFPNAKPYYPSDFQILLLNPIFGYFFATSPMKYEYFADLVFPSSFGICSTK